MTYCVEFLKPAVKQFKKLPSQEQQRLRLKIDALASEPRPNGAIKLSGEEDLYRLRAGNYRVIYAIQDEKLLILVIKIGHRRDVDR